MLYLYIAIMPEEFNSNLFKT